MLDVRNLKVHFPLRLGLFRQAIRHIKAVDDVSFSIAKGQTLGLVGESGSGKTTVGRSILRLQEPTGGEVIFDGVDMARLEPEQMRAYRRRMQIVAQDPYSSLNPRRRVGDIVGEGIRVHRLTKTEKEYRDRLAELFDSVGLDPSMQRRYPHQFSGGQRQRIAIARALAVKPEFIVADEPVSALDVSIQAQLINLMRGLQKRFDLTFLFISHDLALVRHVSDTVAVMYLGKIMEMAPRETIFGKPLHPYTNALLSAVPVPDPEIERKRQMIVLRGVIPSPVNPPPGCVFNTRCPMAKPECRGVVPPLRQVAKDHWVACIRVPDPVGGGEQQSKGELVQ
jgi:peptide/nickel transport system ATP-binding protein